MSWSSHHPVRLIGACLACLALCLASVDASAQLAATGDTLLPRHMDAATVQAVERGLQWLAANQADDGSFRGTQDGNAYPISMTGLAGMAFLAHGDTPTRGPYADQLRAATDFILSEARPDGLISIGAENGRTMYGHGFSLLFLATVYGMETDQRVRNRMHTVIEKAIKLTGQAQSPRGGWYYTPGSGDEGSVTVTQLQALRACQNAGFTVNPNVIEQAIHYLEICQGPEGGIVYSFGSGGGSRPAISAAAITCLYSAGEYDSPLADQCLEYVWDIFNADAKRWSKAGGHDFYAHYYAAQSFYQAGEDYWGKYFPETSKQLLQMQQNDGHWDGDGIGPVYGTAMACTILQLPYKYLPIYQR